MMRWFSGGLLSILFLCNLSLAQSLPNVVLLMGDDHGWEETGYNGHPYVKTPVLDEIAHSGLKFERFHASHSSCSPTRAAFMTGRHPNRMGTFSAGRSFRPEEITIAHLLSQGGYHCAHLGKWHIGAVKASSPVNPGAMGFDEWLSHDNFFELNPSLSRNGGEPETFEGESSEILIREAIGSIERAREQNKPFFIVVWFGSPHEPYSALPEDLALYDHLPAKYADKMVKLTSNETGSPTTRPQGEVLRERFAEITALDRSIGTLRKHLAKTGLRENTILFYCGDNGTSADGWVASPHRGIKTSIYNGGTLVPGLVEWPARIQEPRSTKVRASTSDLLPTLAAIAGQPVPDRPIDGIDLLPVLSGQMSERPKPLHFWNFDESGRQRAIASGLISKPLPYIAPALQAGTTPLVKRYRGGFTRNFVNFHHPEIVDSDYRGARAVIDGRYKLVLLDEAAPETPAIELYDLETDPAEEHNIASQHPEVVDKLKLSLHSWQSNVLKSLTGADYR